MKKKNRGRPEKKNRAFTCHQGKKKNSRRLAQASAQSSRTNAACVCRPSLASVQEGKWATSKGPSTEKKEMRPKERSHTTCASVAGGQLVRRPQQKQGEEEILKPAAPRQGEKRGWGAEELGNFARQNDGERERAASIEWFDKGKGSRERKHLWKGKCLE